MIKLDIQMNISFHEARMKADHITSEKMLQMQTEEQAFELFVTECCDLQDGKIYLLEDFHDDLDFASPVGTYTMAFVK